MPNIWNVEIWSVTLGNDEIGVQMWQMYWFRMVCLYRFNEGWKIFRLLKLLWKFTVVVDADFNKFLSIREI